MSGDTSQQTGPAAADEADPWVPSRAASRSGGPTAAPAARRSSRRRRRVDRWLVVGLAVGLVVTSPGWERVKETFFDWDKAVDSFPAVLEGLWLNIRIMLICAVLIAIFGLTLAVMRTIRGPVAFPLRLFATAYVDLFRGLPLLLVLFLLGFGVPALRLSGPAELGAVLGCHRARADLLGLRRRGVPGRHRVGAPVAAAAARSLGLTYGQTLRHVVLPQAVRRVVPAADERPGLAAEGLRPDRGARRHRRDPRRPDRDGDDFNFTPYVVAASVRAASPSRWPGSPTTSRASRACTARRASLSRSPR